MVGQHARKLNRRLNRRRTKSNLRHLRSSSGNHVGHPSDHTGLAKQHPQNAPVLCPRPQRLPPNDPAPRRRTNPQDHDPSLVNSHAARTRWLALNPLPQPTPPLEYDSDAAAESCTPVPLRRVPRGGGRWSHLPFKLVSRILRLCRTTERERSSPVGDRGCPPRNLDHCGARCVCLHPSVPRVGACGVCGGLRVGGGHLRPDVRQPGVRQLLLVFPARAREEAGGGHRLPPLCDAWQMASCQPPVRALVREPARAAWAPAVLIDEGAYKVLKLLVANILPRLNGVSPQLVALELGVYYGSRFEAVLNDADFATSLLGWNSSACRLEPRRTLAATRTLRSAPRSVSGIDFPFGRRTVSALFIRKLVSLQPPLRRVVLFGSYLESETLLADLLAACPTLTSEPATLSRTKQSLSSKITRPCATSTFAWT
ncbi:hypothetical protein BDK51DRAFT_48380 [Blyttiomyces helicus]|uniref:Uncharacterized protein n=1 Tax=Blyttiomyces helicus TaxID=388810 RepID=A0A4P9WII0_9FUNG|nr:hypothetical protein BDK51DRAFT_48380 [Blyttiomyces helicus]|eukprot:RKO91815.1 hypothetical protein BDK51DRAFT_48380 [Blyttiomyces helicus]